MTYFCVTIYKNHCSVIQVSTVNTSRHSISPRTWRGIMERAKRILFVKDLCNHVKMASRGRSTKRKTGFLHKAFNIVIKASLEGVNIDLSMDSFTDQWICCPASLVPSNQSTFLINCIQMRHRRLCLQKDLFSTSPPAHTQCSTCPELGAISACSLPLTSHLVSSQGIQTDPKSTSDPSLYFDWTLQIFRGESILPP